MQLTKLLYGARRRSGVSLFFDLYLKEALAGFLVVFRFWRVVRVGTSR
jgi:hypothetical protein